MTASIILKKSSVAARVPVAGDLQYGELALNYADGALYYKRSDNEIQNIIPVNPKPKLITVTNGTTNLNLAEADNFHLTLQANTAITVSNAASKIGTSGNIVLKQDATGGRTFTKATEMKTPIGGAVIDQWTTANSLSIITYYVVDQNTVIINYIGNFA